jgi:hypothetical protein
MEKAKEEEGQNIEAGRRLTKVIMWDTQVTVALTPAQEAQLLRVVLGMASENAVERAVSHE